MVVQNQRCPFLNTRIIKKTCKFALVQCDLCGSPIRKCDLAVHKGSECELRPLQCQYGCGVTVTARNMQNHLSSCPNSTSMCALCHKSLPLGAESEHYSKQCTAPCPLGCVQSEPVLLFHHFAEPSLMEAHLAAMLGLVKSLPSLQQIAASSSEQSVKDVKLTADEMKSLEAKISQTQATVESCFSQGSSATPLDSQSIHELLNFAGRFHQIQAQVTDLDDIMKSLTADVNILTQYQPLVQEIKNTNDDFRRLIHDKVASLDRSVHLRESELRSQKLRLTELSKSSDDGKLLWKISGCHNEREKARANPAYSTVSPVFSSSPYGYRMQAKMFINGDGQGAGTHISVYFCLLRGEYDNLLDWPFSLRVTLSLIDQTPTKVHKTESLPSERSSGSFGKPTTESNVGSGYSKFALISEVCASNSRYVVDDTMFFMIKVGGRIPDNVQSLTISSTIDPTTGIGENVTPDMTTELQHPVEDQLHPVEDQIPYGEPSSSLGDQSEFEMAESSVTQIQQATSQEQSSYPYINEQTCMASRLQQPCD